MAHVRLPYFSTATGRMLFPHFKRIAITAHILDERAVSAVEFGRQMSGPNLMKENPKLEYVMKVLTTDGPYPDPMLEVEYNNGLIWKTKTEDFSCGELRAAAFNRAKLVEFDDMMAGKGKSESDDSGGKKGGKAAAPAGKKK